MVLYLLSQQNFNLKSKYNLFIKLVLLIGSHITETSIRKIVTRFPLMVS